MNYPCFDRDVGVVAKALAGVSFAETFTAQGSCVHMI